MSVHSGAKPVTVPAIRARKGGEPLVALTAYHAQAASWVDPHADIILVGDSLGMVLHGLPSTVGVPLEMMLMHGASAVRGAKRALVVVDLPFGTYEESPETAFRTAARAMAETGCGAVKLEGGTHMAETIAKLTRSGIPVMAHIGLTPQATHTMGGFKTQGRDRADWDRHMADAQAVAEAGAFSVVLEGMVEPLARRITEAVEIPTIGIGASPVCDGQILVLEDMLGLHEWTPKFVREFGALRGDIDTAIGTYAQAVRNRTFPGEAETYAPKD